MLLGTPSTSKSLTNRTKWSVLGTTRGTETCFSIDLVLSATYQIQYHYTGYSITERHLPGPDVDLDEPGVLVRALGTRGPLVLARHGDHVSAVTCPDGLAGDGSFWHGERGNLIRMIMMMMIMTARQPAASPHPGRTN